MVRFFIALMILATPTLYSKEVEEKKIIIMRDAQSENHLMHTRNSDPSHPSYKPSYLTKLGKQQVNDTADSLKQSGITKETVSLTLVSPLPRALQTASALADQGILPRDTLFVDTRLIAVQHGNKEGDMYELNMTSHHLAHEFEGETEEDVLVRVKRLLKDMGSEAPSGHVIIITHGTPAGEIHRLLTGQKKQFSNAGCSSPWKISLFDI